MKLSAIKETHAVWGTALLTSLLMILVIAIDLPNQALVPPSAPPAPLRLVKPFPVDDALLDSAEWQIENQNYAKAWETLLQAEDLFRKYERLELLARVHWLRTRMLHELKEFEAAREEIERSATIAQNLESDEYRTQSHYLLALNFYGRKEYQKAYRLLESYVNGALKAPPKEAIHFHNLAGLCRDRAGDTYEAEQHFLRGLQLSTQLNTENYGFLYGNLGKVYANQGRHEDAARYLTLDFEWSCRADQTGSAASAAYLLAEILSATGALDDRQRALLFLQAADSLVLHAGAQEVNIPSDSLWWGIQRKCLVSFSGVDMPQIQARRSALNRKRAEEVKRTNHTNQLHAEGRNQWKKHTEIRNRRAQISGQSLSFAAGILLLVAVVLFKPHTD